MQIPSIDVELGTTAGQTAVPDPREVREAEEAALRAFSEQLGEIGEAMKASGVLDKPNKGGTPLGSRTPSPGTRGAQQE